MIAGYISYGELGEHGRPQLSWNMSESHAEPKEQATCALLEGRTPEAPRTPQKGSHHQLTSLVLRARAGQDFLS